MNEGSIQRVGLVAGGGQFPKLFSRAARNKGIQVFAAAFEGHASPDLAREVTGIERMYLGEILRLIQFFKQHRVEHAVFLGNVEKTQIFTDLRLDEKALEILGRVDSTRDDAVMRSFSLALEEDGIQVMPSTWLLPELLAPEGCWTQRPPNEQEQADLAFGFALAKKIGELDIGQCLVVGKGSVLAVEAIDGTDATIRRGGSLAPGNAVVVKVRKPGQDKRFDLPAAGVETVRSMAGSGATALGVEAGESVVFDREEMVSLADREGISIVGLSPREEES